MLRNSSHNESKSTLYLVGLCFVVRGLLPELALDLVLEEEVRCVSWWWWLSSYQSLAGGGGLSPFVVLGNDDQTQPFSLQAANLFRKACKKVYFNML